MQPDQHTPADRSGIQAQRDEYLKRLREAQAEADRLRGERDEANRQAKIANTIKDNARRDMAEYAGKLAEAEQALQRAVGARDRLAMLAAKAIQTGAFATDPTDPRGHGPIQQRLHRTVGRHMAELRQEMGDDWMRDECGWASTSKEDGPE